MFFLINTTYIFFSFFFFSQLQADWLNSYCVGGLVLHFVFFLLDALLASGDSAACYTHFLKAFKKAFFYLLLLFLFYPIFYKIFFFLRRDFSLNAPLFKTVSSYIVSL